MNCQLKQRPQPHNHPNKQQQQTNANEIRRRNTTIIEGMQNVAGITNVGNKMQRIEEKQTNNGPQYREQGGSRVMPYATHKRRYAGRTQQKKVKNNKLYVL